MRLTQDFSPMLREGKADERYANTLFLWICEARQKVLSADRTVKAVRMNEDTWDVLWDHLNELAGVADPENKAPLADMRFWDMDVEIVDTMADGAVEVAANLIVT